MVSVFTRMARVPAEVQGFALSIFGNSYVSGPRISELALVSGGRLRYSIHEGSVAHIVAHEIAHIYITDTIGRNGWKQLPHWKQEGLPEYIANIALLRQDTIMSMANRIRILENDRQWRGKVNPHHQSWNRIHYEAGLLVEFLFEKEQYSLDDIIANSVTKTETRAAMLAWAESRQAGI